MPNKRHSRVTGDSDRKFGETPGLGRVTRTPQSAVQGNGVRRRDSKSRRHRNRLNFLWTAVIAFCLLLLSVVLLVTYFRNKADAASVAAELDRTAQELAGAFRQRKMPEQPSLGESEALGIARAALSNKDPEAVTSHFILTESTSPAEALRLLGISARKDGEISEYTWLGERFANGQTIGEVIVNMKNGDKLTNRLAQFIIGSDKKWRIDLDSYLRRCVPDWPEILSHKSTDSVVRIFIAEDTYYNGIYADDRIWQAYTMASPDLEQPLFGYVRRDTPQHKTLLRIMAYEDNSHRATLRITAQTDTDAKQFEITGVLSDSWVLGAQDFDKAF